MKEKIQLAVFGSDEDHCSEKQAQVAEEVGREIAKSGATLLTGGLKGVMYYVSKGAKENNGSSNATPTIEKLIVNFIALLFSIYLFGYLIIDQNS